MTPIVYIPSRSAIRQACVEIQAGWTTAEERKRRGLSYRPTYYKIPQLTPHKRGRMTIFLPEGNE